MATERRERDDATPPTIFVIFVVVGLTICTIYAYRVLPPLFAATIGDIIHIVAAAHRACMGMFEQSQPAEPPFTIRPLLIGGNSWKELSYQDKVAFFDSPCFVYRPRGGYWSKICLDLLQESPWELSSEVYALTKPLAGNAPDRRIICQACPGRSNDTCCSAERIDRRVTCQTCPDRPEDTCRNVAYIDQQPVPTKEEAPAPPQEISTITAAGDRASRKLCPDDTRRLCVNVDSPDYQPIPPKEENSDEWNVCPDDARRLCLNIHRPDYQTNPPKEENSTNGLIVHPYRELVGGGDPYQTLNIKSPKEEEHMPPPDELAKYFPGADELITGSAYNDTAQTLTIFQGPNKSALVIDVSNLKEGPVPQKEEAPAPPLGMTTIWIADDRVSCKPCPGDARALCVSIDGPDEPSEEAPMPFPGEWCNYFFGSDQPVTVRVFNDTDQALTIFRCPAPNDCTTNAGVRELGDVSGSPKEEPSLSSSDNSAGHTRMELSSFSFPGRTKCEKCDDREGICCHPIDSADEPPVPPKKQQSFRERLAVGDQFEEYPLPVVVIVLVREMLWDVFTTGVLSAARALQLSE